MTPDKFRIKFPYLTPEKCRGVNMEEALQEIKFSKHCFVLYSPYDGPAEFLFTGFNEELLITYLVMMGQHQELFEFCKLAVACHEKISKQPKKGMDLYTRVAMYIKSNLQGFTHVHKDEFGVIQNDVE